MYFDTSKIYLYITKVVLFLSIQKYKGYNIIKL